MSSEPSMRYELCESLDTDYFSTFADVTAQDQEFWNTAKTYGAEILPQINNYWEQAHYPVQLVRRMGELDLLTD